MGIGTPTPIPLVISYDYEGLWSLSHFDKGGDPEFLVSLLYHNSLDCSCTSPTNRPRRHKSVLVLSLLCGTRERTTTTGKVSMSYILDSCSLGPTVSRGSPQLENSEYPVFCLDLRVYLVVWTNTFLSFDHPFLLRRFTPSIFFYTLLTSWSLVRVTEPILRP